jgi:hypothetical protein
MKITKCQNRFEVIVDSTEESDKWSELIRVFQDWVLEKKLPSDEQYMAALGPCGK